MGATPSTAILTALPARAKKCRRDKDCPRDACCVNGACTTLASCPQKTAYKPADAYPCERFPDITEKEQCIDVCKSAKDGAKCEFACLNCHGFDQAVPPGWDWLTHNKRHLLGQTAASYYTTWGVTPLTGTVMDDDGFPWVTLRPPAGGADALF
jgi:hypothetical protein